MEEGAPAVPEDSVSRRRYARAVRAREEAEALLEEKSRALWAANEALRRQADRLESEVARRTEELERAKLQAEEANRAKSAFLAVISHEIRTPMNAILGMATGLRESGLSAEQCEMAGVILSSGHVLLDLLNDMLDLSKIEAGKMDVELRAFDLPAMLADVRALFVDVAVQRGLAFDLWIDPQGPAMIVSDPTRLRQVICNLLANAFKFTEAGRVSASVRPRGDMLDIEVRDTGPGVPPDHQPRLFQSFTQGDSSITRRYGGTGLGLVISRRFCRLLGGDLVYEDAPGGGSVFRASVALRTASTDARQRERTSGFEAEAILRARPWNILVAEDSVTNQQVLRLLLKPYGLGLEMVETGELAVQRHASGEIDMILMDVNMPVMDGLTAARIIREAERDRTLAPVPIVALTANAMTHQVTGYLAQGIDAHVSKPVRREELAATMARLLVRRLDGAQT